jgi:deoxyadenosine/deoxycytidine kinase
MIGSMLKKFYSAGKESRKQIGTILQVAFLTFRYQQLKRAVTERNAVMDSSLESDWVLASNLNKRGEIDDVDFNVYATLSQEMQSNVNGMPWNALPDLAIYLKIDPDHEIEEIKHRGREMENVDPTLDEYYRSVNKAYRDWAKGYTRSLLLTIDRDKLDFVNSIVDQNKVLDKIESRLVELGKLTPAEFETIKAKRSKQV